MSVSGDHRSIAAADHGRHTMPVVGPSRELAGRREPLPPALTAAPDVMALLRALQRRWRMGLALGLSAMAMVALTTWCVVPPARSIATARLRIAASPPRIIFPTEENRADYETFRRTQKTMIKGRQVAKAALSRPGVAE